MEKIQQVAIDIDNSVEENSERITAATGIVSGKGTQQILRRHTAHPPKTEQIQDEDTTTGLEISLKKKLDKLPGEPLQNRPVTIFRVPASFHKTNEYLWAPQMVSIGPYHHGKESLRATKEHKLFTLRDFLARKKVGLEVCLREMRALEAQVRLCYSESVGMGNDEFIMMLLLDGCFIVEWLSKDKTRERDSICDVGWSEIYNDLLLLENQLPFSVISKLFFIEDGESHKCEDNCPLLKLIRVIYKLSTAVLMENQISCNNIKHLLHYYYSACVGYFELPDVGESEKDGSNETILCASELHETGIKFKKKVNADHLFSISFENGILEIPFLKIHDYYSVRVWNLVAFEQTTFTTKQIFSSYVAFMDALVNTEKDVVLLQRCGILESYLENEEDAADFFNQFDKHFFIENYDDIYKPLKKKIKSYSESTWHKQRARLMHDYFSNPWSGISVGAATILLALAFIQTIFSAK